MKTSLKTFVAALVAVLSLSGSSAQAQTSGSVLVNFTVTDILVLVVNPAPVILNLAALTDFQNGKDYVALAQLTASSNQPYDIKVKSDGDMQSLTTQNTIPINQISVQAKSTLGGSYSAQKNLSVTEQVMLSNEPSALAKIYDVKYSLPSNSESFFVKGGLYTATLTYSISAH